MSFIDDEVCQLAYAVRRLKSGNAPTPFMMKSLPKKRAVIVGVPRLQDLAGLITLWRGSGRGHNIECPWL